MTIRYDNFTGQVQKFRVRIVSLIVADEISPARSRNASVEIMFNCQIYKKVATIPAKCRKSSRITKIVSLPFSHLVAESETISGTDN